MARSKEDSTGSVPSSCSISVSDSSSMTSGLDVAPCRCWKEPHWTFSSPNAKCRHIIIDVIMLCLTVVLMAGQLAFYNLFFMAYGNGPDKHKIFRSAEVTTSTEKDLSEVSSEVVKEASAEEIISEEDWESNCTRIVEREPHDLEWKYVYYFLGPDITSIAAMAVLPILAVCKRRNNLKTGESECSRALSNIRHASFSWLAYALILDTKIIVSTRGFVKVLQYLEKCHDDVVVGVNAFILMLCFSSLIFFTLVVSHHAHTRETKDFLHRVAESVTFDILDGVHFYSIIFSSESVDFLIENPILEHTIIGLVCVNFLLPSVTLVKLFHKLSKSEDKQRRTRLKHLSEDVIYVLLFLVFINVPYFIIRCYLWRLMRLELSVFLLKNAIMIVIELRQLWIYSRRIMKFKSNVHVTLDSEYDKSS